MKHLKGLILFALVLPAFSFADVGMPKTFKVLQGPAGPRVTGSISEIQLTQLTPLYPNSPCVFFISKVPLQVEMNGEIYNNARIGFEFIHSNGHECPLTMSNIKGIFGSFIHSEFGMRMNMSVDLESRAVELGFVPSGTTVGSFSSMGKVTETY